MRCISTTLILLVSSLILIFSIAKAQPLLTTKLDQNLYLQNPNQLIFKDAGNSTEGQAVGLEGHKMGNVFLIRHAEKRKREKPGLSERGLERAECLRGVFGKGKRREVDFVMAQDFKPDGRRKRPFETVLPLAKDLNKKVHRGCDRDDPKCAASVVNHYASQSKNVLLAWEHNRLSEVAQHLGVKHLRYPSSRYDIIFRLRANKNGKWKVRSITSEECKHLDGKFKGWHARKFRGKFVDSGSWETEREAEEGEDGVEGVDGLDDGIEDLEEMSEGLEEDGDEE